MCVIHEDCRRLKTTSLLCHNTKDNCHRQFKVAYSSAHFTTALRKLCLYINIGPVKYNIVDFFIKGVEFGGAFADQKHIKKGHQLKAITATNYQGNGGGQTWPPGKIILSIKKYFLPIP